MITVRAPLASDHAAWLKLWQGYNAFYNRSNLAEAITQTLWRRVFDPSEPVFALVAELDGRVVGLAHYLYHASTSSIEPNCYLQDLFTAEEARGYGVGRRLIEGVYAAAKSAGTGRVYWHTHESNTTARALYDRIGENSGFLVYRHMF